MSNSLDFRESFFDGIYNPYRSSSSIKNDTIIEELGYNHDFDANRDILDRFTLQEQQQEGIEQSSKENSFNVILDSNLEFGNSEFQSEENEENQPNRSTKIHDDLNQTPQNTEVSI